MAVVTMRQLLESGVHFGHQTRRWNPKMKRFIFTERNGIYIIDLQQSLSYIDRAYEFVKETVAHGGTILFVGTKKQAQEAIAEQATRVGMPYVNQRWLGGMLTNFQTVHKRLQRLKELEEIDFDGRRRLGPAPRRSSWSSQREKDKLEQDPRRHPRHAASVPSAVWIVDTKKEHIAVGEARKLGIPVVAILDTNCDPDEVDYPIPGNDDAIRSVALLTRVIADAVAEGLIARAGRQADAGRAAPAEPLAEWERELLERRARLAAEAPSRRGRCRRARGRRPSSPTLPPRPRPPRPPRPTQADAARRVAGDDAAEAAAPTRRPTPKPRSCRLQLRRRHDMSRRDYDHGELHRRRRQEAPRAHRRRHDGLQEGARRGRRRPRQGRRDPAHQGRRRTSASARAAPRPTASSPPSDAATARRAGRAQLRDRLRRQERRVQARGRRRSLEHVAVDQRRPTSRPLLAAELEAGKTVQRAASTRPAPRSARRSSSRRVAQFDGDGLVASTCTAPAPTCRRRSASWSSWTRATTPRPRQGRRAAHRRVRAEVPHPRRRSRPSVVENERRIAEATAREEGKPEAALPKIVEGRVNGFFKETSLLEQAFAKDNKKTVAQVLDEAGVTAHALRPLPGRRLSRRSTGDPAKVGRRTSRTVGRMTTRRPLPCGTSAPAAVAFSTCTSRTEADARTTSR